MSLSVDPVPVDFPVPLACVDRDAATPRSLLSEWRTADCPQPPSDASAPRLARVFEYLMGPKLGARYDRQLLGRYATLFGQNGVEALRCMYAKSAAPRRDGEPEPRIPRVLHMIWVGPRSFPPASVANVESWMHIHPDWTFKFWTDRERPAPAANMEVHLTDELAMPTLGRLLERTDNWAERADLLRYEILLAEGGVYADHDVEVLNSFAPLHQCYDFYAGLEPHDAISLASHLAVGNCLIGARPGHPVLAAAVAEVARLWEVAERELSARDKVSNFMRVLFRTFNGFNFGVLAALGSPGYRDVLLPAASLYADEIFPGALAAQLAEDGLVLAKHKWDHAWADGVDCSTLHAIADELAARAPHLFRPASAGGPRVRGELPGDVDPSEIELIA